MQSVMPKEATCLAPVDLFPHSCLVVLYLFNDSFYLWSAVYRFLKLILCGPEMGWTEEQRTFFSEISGDAV